MFNAHDSYEMADCDIDAMFIKNKNEIKRMEAELGSKPQFTSEVIFEEEVIHEQLVDD